MSGQSIVRAVLTGSDGSTVRCQFNPATVRVTKSSTWHAVPTVGAKGAPQPQFTGTGPELLMTKLLFDGFDTLGASGPPVAESITQLLDWTCVPEESRDSATPNPPLVTFRWGTGIGFTGFLRRVNAEYTMFDADGTPLRATADIMLQRTPDDPRGTNPTSGGVPGRRGAVLQDADSLAALAYREYGDAGLWRAIAQANDLEDPARVPVGTRLLVPPRTEAVGGEGAR